MLSVDTTCLWWRGAPCSRFPETCSFPLRLVVRHPFPTHKTINRFEFSQQKYKKGKHKTTTTTTSTIHSSLLQFTKVSTHQKETSNFLVLFKIFLHYLLPIKNVTKHHTHRHILLVTFFSPSEAQTCQSGHFQKRFLLPHSQRT